MAEYFKVDEGVILAELEEGHLKGFKIGGQWRSSEIDIKAFLSEKPTVSREGQLLKVVRDQKRNNWEITKIEPFDFNWPKKGGGGNTEHYDEAYEATKTEDGRHYTFKIGFGYREAAGLLRRRVTIWIGSRAIVEFTGGNNFNDDGILAGIIRNEEGKQIKTKRVPEKYAGFKTIQYDSIVQGPRASGGMAVIAHKSDLVTMLEHAWIRAVWKELL